MPNRGDISAGTPFLRGTVAGATGAVIDGSGFTAARTGTGIYVVTFNPAMTFAPAVFITPFTGGIVFTFAQPYLVSGTSFTCKIQNRVGTAIDKDFVFWAAAIR